ncbi:TPA: hypothetical protein N0H21_001280 [Pseudomonas aeruginosa]|nr:hypothetical protein [Pseudomonas aeruginosa]
MSYTERATEIKRKVDEAVASNAGYDELEKYVQPYEEICKDILMNENGLNDDIYTAIKIIRFSESEGGETFEFDYEMPFLKKCILLFFKPSAIICLGLNKYKDEERIIKINNIEYRTLEAYRNYGEKESELESTAYSIMNEDSHIL